MDFSGDEIEAYLYKNNVKEIPPGSYVLDKDNKIIKWSFHIPPPSAKLDAQEFAAFSNQVKEDRRKRLQGLQNVSMTDFSDLLLRVQALEAEILKDKRP